MTLIETREREAEADPPPAGRLQSSWVPQRRGALLAVAAIVAGLLVGVGAATLVGTRNPVYSSKAVLLMDQPGAISLANGDGVVLKLSRLRLKYAGLVGTEIINTAVGQRLGVPATSIAGQVSAAVPPDNLNIVISSQTADRSRAQGLAAESASALQSYLDHEQRIIPPNVRLHLTLIQPALAVSASGNGDHRRAVVGIAAGVLAAAAVAALGLLRR